MSFLLRIITYIKKEAVFLENIDSYYFALFSKKDYCIDALSCTVKHFGVYYSVLILFLVSFVIIIIVWCILFKYKWSMSGMLIIFSAFFYMNTKYAFLDKNVYSLLIITASIYLILENRYLSSIILNLICVFYVWDGFVVMILLTVILAILFNRKRRLYYIIIFILSIPISVNVCLKLIPTMFIIKQTMPIFIIGILPEFYLFICILIISFYIRNLLTIPEKKILYLSFLTLILTVIMYRIHIFMIIPIFLLVGIITNYLNMKNRLILLVLFIVSILITIPGFLSPTIDNITLQEAINYTNTQNTSCLISDWGYGHIYQYYTDKDVYFKGHPFIEKQIYSFNNPENCSIIYKTGDIKYIHAVSKIEKPFIIESLDTIDFYDKLRNITYYVIIK